MPKASVNKNGQALPRKDEIGLAGKKLMAAPPRDAVRPQNGCKLQLGGTIAGGANRSHDLRSLLLCEHVSHAAICTTKKNDWESHGGMGGR